LREQEGVAAVALEFTLLTVLDFGRYIAAPYCGALLGALGAEVIRIESFEGNDDRYVMPIAPDAGALYCYVNQNKCHYRLICAWERRVRGPDVKLFFDISVNSFRKFDVGQSKHGIHTNKNGKVIHEGVLSRLDPEEFLLFGPGGFWADYNLCRGKYNASSEPDDLFNLQVSGPNAIYLLEKACGQCLRGVTCGAIRIITQLIFPAGQNLV
jgi:hypothetical protein